MKVVILCGGMGIRLWPSTQTIPKPLIRIGGKPILWHVMKFYERFGYRDFVLCLGYKGDLIRKYFRAHPETWNIDFAETGLETPTGGRIKKIEHLVDGNRFLTTYADGLANLRLDRLVRFHERSAKVAAITVVRPLSPFGIVTVDGNSSVLHFEEKPQMNQWINGGFFVFSEEVFDHIETDDVLERDVFEKLVKIDELVAFKHRGFWRCMDTYKDAEELNKLAREKKVPWNISDGGVWRTEGS